MGFQHNLHIKSMFLGQNKYIFGRFGGHMDTINTSTQSGKLRMRLNVSTRVQTEDQRFLKSKFKLQINSDDIFLAHTC
jgi:hypothetical protein